MFYCEDFYTKQRAPFLDYTSSCITHDDAYTFDSHRANKNKKWSDSELIDLHNKSSVFQVDQLIESICTCHIGQPVNIDNVENILLELERVVNVISIKYTEKVQ